MYRVVPTLHAAIQPQRRHPHVKTHDTCMYAGGYIALPCLPCLGCGGSPSPGQSTASKGGDAQGRRSRVNWPPPSMREGCCCCTRYSPLHMHARHSLARNPSDRSHPFGLSRIELDNADPQLSIWVALATYLAAPTRDGMVQHGVRHRYHWSPRIQHGGGSWRGGCPAAAAARFLPPRPSPSLAWPGTWHLAPGSPETGGHCDSAATLSGRLAGWGNQTSRDNQDSICSLPCRRSRDIPSLMIPLRPLSPVARTGALGPPLSSCPQYGVPQYSTCPSHPSFVGQGWVWGKRILLGLLPKDMHAHTHSRLSLPAVKPCRNMSRDFGVRFSLRDQLPARIQATISRIQATISRCCWKVPCASL